MEKYQMIENKILTQFYQTKKSKMKQLFHRAIFLIAILTVIGLFHSCTNKTDRLIVLYDQGFEQINALAKKKGKHFCIVLSRPNCPPCQHYIIHLGELYKDLASKVIFNVVDVSLPENQWYMHWLATGASPTTTIFSPNGELKAVVAGITKNAIECIKSSIASNTECSRYFYQNHFRTNSDVMQVLNTLLACKLDLDKGKDISETINVALARSQHPYTVYLKSISEVAKGQHEEAAYWANDFLQMVNSNSYFSRVYSNVNAQIRTIINPNYTPGDEGILSVVGEVALGDRKFKQPAPFSLTLTNTGSSELIIHDIQSGCTCVRLASKRTLTLQPQESQKVDFVFTGDVRGDVFREITFFSNGSNPMQRVRLTATVQ